MPTICKVEGCENPVWNKDAGYCKFHMYKAYISTKKKREGKYTKAKKKALKKAIKPISDKRKEQLKEYDKRKQEKAEQLKKENKWFCFFCGVPFKENEKPDMHHVKDRENDSVFDMDYTVFAHRRCHTLYHSSSYATLSSYNWYKAFLERLKEIDIKLYNKEINKANK